MSSATDRSTSASAMRKDLAIVTKTYAGDFEACRQLCASVDRWIDPAIRHDLLIDRRDRDLFAPLASPRRRIVETEPLLPALRPVTFRGRRFWLNPLTLPVRGWIQQQLAKIAHVASLDETAVVLIDSDALFIKALDEDAILKDGRVRLYRTPLETQPANHGRWHRTAATLFDIPLPESGHFGADYIAQAITWSPAVARAMIKRLDARSMHPWYVSLGRQTTFSEYVLYGVFAQHAPDAPKDVVFTDPTDLCLSFWYEWELPEAPGADGAPGGLQPHHVALHLQSNIGLDKAARDRIVGAVTGATALAPAPAS